MEWTDEGIVLGVRPHGETHAIARLFTREHGAVAALVHGGQGKTKGSLLQPGNGVEMTFRARREEALGHFELELAVPRAAAAMGDRQALLGLTAVTDLLFAALPEGVAYPPLYAATAAVLDLLEDQSIWPVVLVKWELGVLDALGYGLTLDKCAATGELLEDGAELVFVSPKSGTAVSYKAGMPYKDRMLPLPPFVIDQGEPTIPDVKAALQMTGYFLAEWLLASADKSLSDARERFIARI